MKHIDRLKEILESELGDYSGYFDYNIEFDERGNSDETVEFYTVHVQGIDDNRKSLEFAITDDKVEIELSEDSWYEIEHFNWTIKYFWMALLRWT